MVRRIPDAPDLSCCLSCRGCRMTVGNRVGVGKKRTPAKKWKMSCHVGVRRLELPTSSSRTTRAANCATPRSKYNSLTWSEVINPQDCCHLTFSLQPCIASHLISGWFPGCLHLRYARSGNVCKFKK